MKTSRFIRLIESFLKNKLIYIKVNKFKIIKHIFAKLIVVTQITIMRLITKVVRHRFGTIKFAGLTICSVLLESLAAGFHFLCEPDFLSTLTSWALET